jgi:predicted small integral membrane protein
MAERTAGNRLPRDILALRAAKITTVAIVAAFFSIVTYGNIADFDTNYQFVRHVLSMDTTFRSPQLMWRAIDDPVLHKIAYWIIIGWEGATATSCWLGVASLCRAWPGGLGDFDRARTAAIIGLLLGVILYGLGFLVIASEWFAMWQSDDWNAQATAGMFTTVLFAALIFVAMRESTIASHAEGGPT